LSVLEQQKTLEVTVEESAPSVEIVILVV
jgi:hypothetical protein